VPSRFTAKAGSPVAKSMLWVPEAIQACERARVDAVIAVNGNGIA
jgi:hypothetical protein